MKKRFVTALSFICSLLTLDANAQAVHGTAGRLSLNLSSVSGTLPIGNGGTGLATLGSSGTCLQSNGSALVYGSCGSGGGTPGGTSGQIQYNNGGSFGGLTTLPIANGGTNCATTNCYYGAPHWQSKLNNVRNGTGNARLCFVGDSTIFGAWSTVGDTGDQTISAYPTKLAAFLTSANGIKANRNGFMGDGSLYEGAGETSGADARVVKGNAWSRDSSNVSVGGYSYKATTNTNALSFTPSVPVNVFRYVYITQSGGGSFTVDIDGSGAQTISTSGSAGVQTGTITAGSVGSHTINFNWSSGGQVNIVGVEESYDNTQSWVNVVNMGWSGATAANWALATQPYNPSNNAIWSALGCDLTIVEGGINDWLALVSTSAFSTSMQTNLSAIASSGSDIIIQTPIPSPTGTTAQATQQGYVNVLNTLAQTNGYPLFDMFTRYQTNAIANTAGLINTSNTIHPNAAGYLEQAFAVADALTHAPLTLTNQLGFAGSGGSGGGSITAGTGDVTFSGSGSVATTVAKIAGVSVGTPTGSGNVVFSASPTMSGAVVINGGASTDAITLNGTPANGTAFKISNTGGHTAEFTFGGSSYTGFYYGYDDTSNANIFAMSTGGWYMTSSQPLGWVNNATVSAGGTLDTSLSRGGASATVAVGNGTNGDTTGKVKAAAYISAGTKFTVSGCSAGSTVGGATAGSFASGSTSTCTFTITMGNSAAGSNGWNCDANDETAKIKLPQSAHAANTCSVTGSVSSGDVISFSAIGY